MFISKYQLKAEQQQKKIENWLPWLLLMSVQWSIPYENIRYGNENKHPVHTTKVLRNSFKDEKQKQQQQLPEINVSLYN